MSYNRCWQVFVLGFAVLLNEAAVGAEFFPLPQLMGSTQAGDALAVSADGGTVVGTSHDGMAFHAVKWTFPGGIAVLENRDFSVAFGVSGNGSAAVGYREAILTDDVEALRWTASTVATPLGDLPGGEPASFAYSVSVDGAVIVGNSSSSNGSEAFRWTAITGIVGLGDLPGGAFGSTADGTSGDGSVVVGEGLSESGSETFRWTADQGMVGLGDLQGGGFFSDANDVSADGSVVVGRSAASFLPNNMRAFRWSAETGMVALPEFQEWDLLRSPKAYPAMER